jgi:hypothetical protein
MIAELISGNLVLFEDFPRGVHERHHLKVELFVCHPIVERHIGL